MTLMYTKVKFSTRTTKGIPCLISDFISLYGPTVNMINRAYTVEVVNMAKQHNLIN